MMLRAAVSDLSSFTHLEIFSFFFLIQICVCFIGVSSVCTSLPFFFFLQLFSLLFLDNSTTHYLKHTRKKITPKLELLRER